MEINGNGKKDLVLIDKELTLKSMFAIDKGNEAIINAIKELIDEP